MRHRILISSVIIAGMIIFAGWAGPQAGGQTTDTQAAPQMTAQQQKQLDHLRQMGNQLQKDRAAVHEAIGKFGFDSNQVDAAREQLVRDRTEYRQLRRSLVAAGVAVPAASGMGFGRSVARQGRMSSRCRGMAMRGRSRGLRGQGMRMMRGGGRCQCPYWGR